MVDLSEDTYNLIEENAGEATANYIRDRLRDTHGRNGIMSQSTGASEMESISIPEYKETARDEGYRQAVDQFFNDLEEFQKNVLVDLAQSSIDKKVNDMEI